MHRSCMLSWSSGHCDATTTSTFSFEDFPETTTPTTVPGPTTTPDPPESSSPSVPPLEPSSSSTQSPDPPSSSEPPPEPPSASNSSLESSSTPPLPEPSDPEPSDPPPPPSATEPYSSLPRPQPSSDSPSPTPTPSSETLIVTPSAVPKPSFVPISIAPHVPAQTTDSISSSSTHSTLPRWSGSGNLLQGYCATPEYTILDGPTAYWAPVIGCIADRPDCCPFDVLVSTLGVSLAPQTVTVTMGATMSPNSPAPSGDNGSGGGFPSALSPAQATLDSCPDDYHSVNGGCCPLNYFPWSTAFGGQTPCYSTLPVVSTPPLIPNSLLDNATTTAAAKPTSAIVNVVYAMQYPVQTPKQGMSTNAKIGIGAGAGGAALIFGVLTALLIWKHRAHKRDKAALESLSGFGPGMSSTRASHVGGSQVGTGVREWRSNVPPPPVSGPFHEGGLEPTLPNVPVPATYAADWRPGQRTMSPPYAPRSPSIPEGYSEVDSQQGMLAVERRYSNNNTPGLGSDGGYSTGNRSELQSGEYPFPRQELQGVPEGQAWEYRGQSPQQGGPHHLPQGYYEAPGRMQ
ncbi:hypothetical protein CC78DRAFT_568770 [Lojkania enalia]|uniref:Uncharacterized protein n=1 Tax=Lojkania enalia TaxID=147567 RepID=A0A9P4K9S5_9PLEO|nr:hypothetical protein CC78DRAFT_568770 [Didymosphaeria enalia]